MLWEETLRVCILTHIFNKLSMKAVEVDLKDVHSAQ